MEGGWTSWWVGQIRKVTGVDLSQRGGDLGTGFQNGKK